MSAFVYALSLLSLASVVASLWILRRARGLLYEAAALIAQLPEGSDR